MAVHVGSCSGTAVVTLLESLSFFFAVFLFLLTGPRTSGAGKMTTEKK